VRSFKCYTCNRAIKFDSSVRSKSDKAIPLNLDGSKHDCPKSLYNKGKAFKDEEATPRESEMI
jgi:hypothetical protein